MILWLLAAVALPAHARPDEGSGSYSFDDSDVLATLDSPNGLVRVTYSADGPNQVRAGDDDADGIPDFVKDVALTAEDVLQVYADAGFAAPLSEEAMGLDPLGGSYAFDIYLVDFAGVADGWFDTDACMGTRCSGYMAMENDFRGYGYSSIDTAIRVLVSHELFHAVQAATNTYQPDWMREGTAVWAEHLYAPENEDFLWFCDSYLDDTSRSLDHPPAGAVTSFTYATALWWDFLVERYGVESAVALQDAMQGEDEDAAVEVMASVIASFGGDLTTDWPDFATWNLATGDRAGSIDSYPFAAQLNGVTATAEGASIQDLNRFYPLASTYYRLDHPGGPLWFATLDDPTGIVFQLHAVADGAADGPVGEAVLSWDAVTGATELGDLDAGGYWLVGTYPQIADESVKIDLCLGADTGIAACEAQDTGATDTGEAPKDGTCGCASARGAGGYGPLIGLLLLYMRRKSPAS